MSDNSQRRRSLGSNMLWNSVGSFFYFACQYLPTILVVRMATGLNASGVFNYAMNTTNAFLTIAITGCGPIRSAISRGGTLIGSICPAGG